MKTMEELLESCLREMESGATPEGLLARHPEARGLEPLISVAERVHRAPVVGPSAAFRASAKDRLLNLVAQDERATAATRESSYPWWRRLAPVQKFLPAAVSLVAILLTVSIAAVAASGAPPSSILYPARLAMEDLRVRLTSDSWERAELYLAIADGRVDDLARMPGETSEGDLEQLAGQYQAAIESAVKEVEREGTPPAHLGAVEERLAAEAGRLREARAKLDPSERQAHAIFGELVQFSEEQRTQLRQRAPIEVPKPSAVPEPSQGQQTGQEKSDGAGEPAPSLASPPLEAEIPPGVETSDGAATGPQQEGHGLQDQAGGTVPNATAQTPAQPTAVTPAQPTATPSAQQGAPAPAGDESPAESGPGDRQRNGGGSPTSGPTTVPSPAATAVAVTPSSTAEPPHGATPVASPAPEAPGGPSPGEQQGPGGSGSGAGGSGRR